MVAGDAGLAREGRRGRPADRGPVPGRPGHGLRLAGRRRPAGPRACLRPGVAGRRRRARRPSVGTARDYLAAPFEVYGERGPQFEARLAEWGAPVFGALFAPVGRCSPFPRRRLCAHLAGSVQSSLPARVMRSEPDATPCAQAAQLNVSPRPTSDVDQPPVATHQIDQICSYQKSVAI